MVSVEPWRGPVPSTVMAKLPASRVASAVVISSVQRVTSSPLKGSLTQWLLLKFSPRQASGSASRPLQPLSKVESESRFALESRDNVEKVMFLTGKANGEIAASVL